jgi:16S rRNA processing protein RimM
MGEKRILMGVLGRAHGVRGHVRVTSYTAEPADLDDYNPFEDERGHSIELAWVAENIAEITYNGVVVRDRSGAEALVNTKLTIDRDRLPASEDDEEFYLADLVGLQAVTPDGATIGEVTAVLDFGAGASLEIGALLVPFTRAAVPEIDLAGKRLVVIPPAEIAGEPAR